MGRKLTVVNSSELYFVQKLVSWNKIITVKYPLYTHLIYKIAILGETGF